MRLGRPRIPPDVIPRLSPPGQESIQVYDRRDAVVYVLESGRHDHSAVGVAAKNDVAEILPEDFVHYVSDMRSKSDSLARKVGAFPQTAQGRCMYGMTACLQNVGH